MTVDKRWHLAASDKEIGVTDFELQLWRVFYGFLRWQEECEKNANDTGLNGNELALLHVVRMRDKPKTIADIGKILNRADVFNINYSLRKLLKKGLIKKGKPSQGTKTVLYVITEKGIENTHRYSTLRSKVLIDLFNREKNLDLEDVAKSMVKIKAVYDEADSVVAYTKLPEIAGSKITKNNT
jgi:predicted MarR family transcription regulator